MIVNYLYSLIKIRYSLHTSRQLIKMLTIEAQLVFLDSSELCLPEKGHEDVPFTFSAGGWPEGTAPSTFLSVSTWTMSWVRRSMSRGVLSPWPRGSRTWGILAGGNGARCRGELGLLCRGRRPFSSWEFYQILLLRLTSSHFMQNETSKRCILYVCLSNLYLWFSKVKKFEVLYEMMMMKLL